jgi:predicted transcriptional regulator
VDQLVRLCLGAYPVITVVGEGGIGKTALALKVAYEILDLPTSPFEAIVWTTAKASQLTTHEVVRIENAIRDSLGMLEQVAEQLGGVPSANPLEEVLEYLGQFRILLILDNLETVLDERIRHFLERLPTGSKVLITSRIGLGAFEVPVKLQAMDQSDATLLLRALAKVRGAGDLVCMPNAKLSKYCARMKNNPGWIKWFVSAVRAGRRPEEVLANPSTFFEFCMSNVFDYLSDDSREVLKALLCIPGRLTLAELAFVGDLDVPRLQQSIQELLRTNMVIMSCAPRGLSFESQYELSELARDYLAREHSPDGQEIKAFTKRKHQLVAAGEAVRSDTPSRTSPCAPKAIGLL